MPEKEKPVISDNDKEVISRFISAYNELKRLKRVKNKTAFNQALGMHAAYFSFFENEERAVPIQYIDKLCEVFHVSKEWIESEKGTMFGTDTEEKENLSQVKEDSEPLVTPINRSKQASRKILEEQEVPLYEHEAAAGLTKLFSNSENVLDFIRIPNLPKCDGAVHISGDSMYPLLKSGDIVMYKQVNDIINGIFFGEMYLLSVIIDDEDYTLVKYIHKSELGDQYVRLFSQNQYHAPKDVPVKNIRALGLIKASIRINSMA